MKFTEKKSQHNQWSRIDCPSPHFLAWGIFDRGRTPHTHTRTHTHTPYTLPYSTYIHTSMHTIFSHTFTCSLSPPPLSFLPSLSPLKPLKLILGRSWLVGLSGPLIVAGQYTRNTVVTIYLLEQRSVYDVGHTTFHTWVSYPLLAATQYFATFLGNAPNKIQICRQSNPWYVRTTYTIHTKSKLYIYTYIYIIYIYIYIHIHIRFKAFP